MKTLLPILGAILLPVLQVTNAAEPVFVVDDPGGAATRVGAPVSIEVDLDALPGNKATPARLRLVEIDTSGASVGATVPAQFLPDSKGATKGRLWWMLPPGEKGPRRFRLVVADKSAGPEMVARFDENRGAVNVSEDNLPVLRYNQDTVPPPLEIVEKFEKNHKPPLYYARGDYIHPIFGPDGQPLTDDYSLDHPHHRGLCWAWPVVRYKGEVRDIWAVCILPPARGAIWARPVRLDRVVSGPVLAEIDAENVWKWGDREPIVRENVLIRAFRQQDRCRFLDVEVRLTALVDEVSIGGRPHASYGGFTFRTFPQFDQRKIDMHIDPPGAEPRRAWFHLTGNFPAGKGLAGVALMENITNPDYPSYPRLKSDNPDHVPDAYPKWRSMQPAWPGDREVPLAKGEPLVLKHRLWIHPGLSSNETLCDVWAAYAAPPAVRIEK